MDGVYVVELHGKTLPPRTKRHEWESYLALNLLRRALKEEYGITDCLAMEYAHHGKPYLRDHKDVYFNLSHCREAVACVVSLSEVGIDVESRGRYKESIARKVLSANEMEQVLAAKDPDLEFTRLWTMKEAVVKLTGQGVSMNMKNVIPNHPEITLEVEERERYVCTVARLNA